MPTRLAAAILLFTLSVTAGAQPAARVFRIGFVTPLASTPEPPTLRAFREVTTRIPIVFAGVSDPVERGIVTNLARPDGNITGITAGIGGSGVGGKRVALLKEAIPNISHIAVLRNSATPMGATYVDEAQAAARSLGVKLDLFDAGDAMALDRALAAIGASGAQGIVVANDPFFVDHRAKLVQYAANKRLPAIYFFKLFVDAGGLMAYGSSLEESYRRAATYVDKILKGARPAELPIEQPTRFELAVNRRAAKALGIAIPQSLLLRADYVVE